MASHGVKKLIYSSTCATYGEPKKMPITEKTPQVSFLRYTASALFYADDAEMMRWCQLNSIEYLALLSFTNIART